MAISEFEIKRYKKIVGHYIEKRRPPANVRDQVDLAFRIEGQSVIIFEIIGIGDQPGNKIESPIAKATYVKSHKLWKTYWQRANHKWQRYEPAPEVKTIEKFLTIVEED